MTVHTNDRTTAVHAEPTGRSRQAHAPSSPSSYTVAELAARWRVGEDKIRSWIRKGELTAVNLASAACRRPLLRVTPEAVADFERRRSTTPPPAPPRRRRAAQVDYYPD
jgi:hypothetical protein